MTEDKKLTDADLEKASGAGISASKGPTAGQYGEVPESGPNDPGAKRAPGHELSPGDMEGLKGGTTAPPAGRGGDTDGDGSQRKKAENRNEYPGGPSVK